jgi:hypothetical protein
MYKFVGSTLKKSVLKKIQLANKNICLISDKFIKTIGQLAKNTVGILSKPWWNGFGVLATIILAIAIFSLGQKIENERHEVSIANIELTTADVLSIKKLEIPNVNNVTYQNNWDEYFSNELLSLMGTTQEQSYTKWISIIGLSNYGPAEASKFLIKIEYGGAGIKPTGRPIVLSDSNVKVRCIGALAQMVDTPIYEINDEFIVDSLFIDDTIMIIQQFELNESVNREFISSQNYRFCLYSLYGATIEGNTISSGIEKLVPSDNGVRFAIQTRDFNKFMNGLTVKGNNIHQNYTWQNRNDRIP